MENMSGKRKTKNIKKGMEDQEIKATKLELKRIEKLIIRKKKEILKEKSRILKEKAMKLCSYHLRMRGYKVNNMVSARTEIDNAIRVEPETRHKSMDDFYVWAFNDSKKKMQRVSYIFNPSYYPVEVCSRVTSFSLSLILESVLFCIRLFIRLNGWHIHLYRNSIL